MYITVCSLYMYELLYCNVCMSYHPGMGLLWHIHMCTPVLHIRINTYAIIVEAHIYDKEFINMNRKF